MKITLITTGGTINSEAGGADGIQLNEKAAGEMAGWFDAGFLEERDITVSALCPFSLHSEEIVPDDWLLLCRTIQEAEIGGAEAIVVSHGTDTMTWSLAAVSVLLGKPNIPMIFTGARLPPGHPETDAKRHLQAAFAWAAVQPEPDLYLVFSSNGDENCYVLWGPSVTWDTNDPRLYLTNAAGELAVIDTTFNIQKFVDASSVRNSYHLTTDSPVELPEIFSDDAVLFHLYPGFDFELLRLAHEQSGKKIILLNLYHSGTACTRTRFDLGPIIQEITKAGGTVIGWPIPDDPADRYVSIVKLIKAGLKPANDPTLEMAYIKALLSAST